MKRLNDLYQGILICAFSTVLFACEDTEDYKNPSLPIETRVQDLLSRMTTEEKAAQLDMLSAKEIVIDEKTLASGKLTHFVDEMCIGAVHDLYPAHADIANLIQRHAVEHSRLGIPLLFIEEGLHGYQGAGGTAFPIPIGNSSSWDTTLLHSIGRVIGSEARAHGVHFILGPNLDLAHEIRWGRVEETFGEDPYLTSRLGVNLIKGMQGDDLKDNDAVAAEPKHFGIHGIPEADFVVDLRREPSRVTLPAAHRVITPARMGDYADHDFTCGAMEVEVLSLPSGCAVRVTVDRWQLAAVSGTFELASPVSVDWLLASPSDPSAFQWDGVLALGEYDWMEEDTARAEGLVLRPGGDVKTRG